MSSSLKEQRNSHLSQMCLRCIWQTSQVQWLIQVRYMSYAHSFYFFNKQVWNILASIHIDVHRYTHKSILKCVIYVEAHTIYCKNVNACFTDSGATHQLSVVLIQRFREKWRSFAKSNFSKLFLLYQNYSVILRWVNTNPKFAWNYWCHSF